MIYVAVLNNGSEGYSKPLAVFSNRALAAAYVAGARGAYAFGIEIYAVEVDAPMAEPEFVRFEGNSK